MPKRFSFIKLFFVMVLLLPGTSMAGTVKNLFTTPLPVATAVKTAVKISKKPSPAAIIAMGSAVHTKTKIVLPGKSHRMTRQSLSTARPGMRISRRSNGTPRQIKIFHSQNRSTQSITALTVAAALSKARAFLNTIKADLRLHHPDKEMAFVDFHTDRLHRSHARFSQKYRGITVWPANLNVHFDRAGEIDLVDGAYIPTPRRLITKPVINAESAIKFGRAAIDGGDKGVVSPPELIVYAPGDQRARLAWKMTIACSMTDRWLVVIDAADGRVLDAYITIESGSLTGSGTDLTGKTVPLSIWSDGQKNYLVDTSKSMYDAAASTPPSAKNIKGGIVTMDMGHNELPADGGTFHVNYITSTSATSGWLPEGVSLAHEISLVYDYYKKVFGWNSFDNKGSTIIGLVRVGNNFDNAFWSNSYSAFFFGDAKLYAVALDVVGHEFTHGVTSASCNLVYRDQPGALNEALSDIFGEAVESYTTGSTDWINGTVFHDAGSRNFKDPSSVVIINNFRYPANMSQFYGPNTAFLNNFKNRDNGGVHINSTIFTHCFYLLAEGMDGAIGIKDAEKIFHRAQIVHLTANSQFIDARLACITSAEELFGKDTVQVKKTAEAFDMVEITDNQATPAPKPAPAVNAADSAVFVNYSSYAEDYYLGRKEDALGDPSYITNYPVAQARASVTGDGSTAFFVDAYNDACFQDTNASSEEQCLGLQGTISSVAMSPDGELYAFVTLDENFFPTNNILVYNLQTDKSRTYTLQTPAVDGESLNTVDHADSMVFTANGKFLVYDAYNLMRQEDGTEYGSWSIYALELSTGHIYALIKPVKKYDIGFPSVGRIHPNLMTFDLVDKANSNVTVMLMDLSTGVANPVAQLDSDWAIPTFTGDDKSIIYSKPDGSVDTGYSLVSQSIDLTTLKPNGDPILFQSDADFGVVYRRGAFVTPVPDIAVAPSKLSFGDVPELTTKQLTLNLQNNGTSELRVNDMILTGDNAFSVKGSWAGLVLPAGAGNVLEIIFTPDQAGDANATLTIVSDDPDTGNLVVTFTGRGTEVIAKHTIVASHEGNGSILPDGSIMVDDGSSQGFNFIPAAGSHIEKVMIDNVSVGSPSGYSFTSVSKDHNLHVIFNEDILSLKGDVNKDSHLNYYDILDILKILTGQTVEGIDPKASFDNDNMIGIGDAVYDLQHNEISTAVTYTVTASAGTHGAIDPSGMISVVKGNSQKFIFTPDTGFKIADVLVNGQSMGSPDNYTFSNVLKDNSISVVFKAADQNGDPENIEILLSEAAGGRYDADDLIEEVLDIAANAIWTASEQAGTPTFTGTLTQVGSTLNFTYKSGPADKMVIVFTNGNHFDIKTDANKFSGYTKGSVDDFLYSHNCDFIIVSNTGINLRLISNTWPTDGNDAVYSMSTINWQRRLTGIYPDNDRLINMDIISRGTLQRSDPSSSRVFSKQNSTLTGTASSGGNTININEQFTGEFSHDSIAKQEVKHFYITNTSSITMGKDTYQLNNFQVNWIMGGIINELDTTPFTVIESEKWAASGQVLHNNQNYGSIGFDTQPVNNTKGPAVILNRTDNTRVELFRPIK